MSFTLNKYVEPDFNQDFLKNAPDCKWEEAPLDLSLIHI